MTQATINFNQPAQRHSPTSIAAAEAIAPDSNRLRVKVLAAIREHGGLTDNQGIYVTGLSPSTYRPRRIELVQRGQVVDSGETRLTASGRKAVVWRVVD